MKHVIISLYLLSLWTCQTFAQQKYEWKEASSGGYTYKYVSNDPMQARFYTLKNGLKVIFSVNKKEPRIQTLIPVRAGSNTDPRNHTGLAHYLEHMLFKGTSKYGSLDWNKEKPLLARVDSLYEAYNKTTDSTKRKDIYNEIDKVSNQAAKFAIANEYDKMMAGMGATGTNAHTWVEETVYEDDIPSNAIDRYLTVQAERFRDPILRIFHTELEAVYEEKNRGIDNDGRKVYETMLETLFPTNNYGQQSTIGTIEHLKNPSLVEIRKYFNAYYVPNNMAVIMVGDFNPDEVIKKIDEKFAYMQPKPVVEYQPNPEVAMSVSAKKEVFGPTPENIVIAFRMPGRIDDEATVLSTLADELMSSGKAGLIDLNLVKQQKVLRASASPLRFKDYMVWQLSGTPKQGQTLDEVKDLLMGQLALLKKGEFDESAIKAVAANYKLSYIQNLDYNGSRANQLMNSFIQTKAENWHEESAMADKIGKVTKAQLVDFVNKYCNENYVVVYKRGGKDASIRKVPKPRITPVEVNREAQSDFLKSVSNMPMADIKPIFVDYNKDLQKGKLDKAEILYVKNTDNDIFRLSYRFDMGSWNNKLLPLATQYLQFLSTDKYTAEQISKEFYALAANFSVNTSGETTTASVSGLQENFTKSVTLFEYVLKNCKPDEKALADLKSRILKQRQNNKQSKEAILSGLNNIAMYGTKNPFNNQLTDAELDKVSAAELVKLLHELGNYSHRIIYFGPKTLPEFTALLAPLHKIPAAFTPYPSKTNFVKLNQTKKEVLFAEYDMVQAEINWVRNTGKYDPALTPTVDLFNNYFGGGMGSIVFQTIRESKALAYSTYAYYVTPSKKTDNYSLIGYVGSQADKLDESIVAMNELIDQMPESAQVLETAKKSMKKTYATERIRQDGIIYSYLSALERGINYDERKLIYDNIDKMTVADVKKFAVNTISGKPATICVVASEKKINVDELKKYGELRKVSLEEIFGY
ncbi:MAG: insulinase family protein [Verrucomicrobia bacterium]|nr:insulinase family protein [Cytophagales bacterium]